MCGVVLHSATDEMPRVTGDAQFRLASGNMNIMQSKNDDPEASGVFSYMESAVSKWITSLSNGPNATRNTDVLHMEFGGNQPHSTLPPSIASYGWRRTA